MLRTTLVLFGLIIVMYETGTAMFRTKIKLSITVPPSRKFIFFGVKSKNKSF